MAEWRGREAWIWEILLTQGTDSALPPPGPPAEGN